jgi:hypothetical protein
LINIENQLEQTKSILNEVQKNPIKKFFDKIRKNKKR